MLARNRKQGFTLVEILIVVVILGILAAIVIPQFTNASESARASSLVSQLQTIRAQLELYQVQHGGSYPDLSTNWDDMTVAAGGFGPYLQQAPKNPFEGNSTTTADAAAAGVGWEYDSTNGTIKAVMSTAKASDLGLDTTNDVSTY